MTFIKMVRNIIVLICIIIGIISCIVVTTSFFAGSNVVVLQNEEISSETMTATLTDFSYNGTVFSGKIMITDSYFDEYVSTHPEEDTIVEYFTDYYEITYETQSVRDVLPENSVGCVVNDDGSGYYYQEFETYINTEDSAVKVKIYVEGIDKPFKIKLK